MCASKNTIFTNIYYKLNAPHITFYRKIVHFQILEYTNEVICIFLFYIHNFIVSKKVQLGPAASSFN